MGSAVKTVGVIGCGIMGSGIVTACAQAGYKTLAYDLNEDFVQRGIKNVDKFLAKNVEKGKISAEDKATTMGLIKGTTNLEAFSDCDIAIEAVVEDLSQKRALFAKLDTICKAETLFCSNTSSLSVTEISAAIQRKESFCGLHFFNPAPVMKLVEIVKSIKTSDEMVDSIKAFAETLGKKAVVAKDRPGFIVNSLVFPYVLEAIRMLESGAASKEDIETAVQLGLGYPMGPFTLCDFSGLDTTLSVAQIMYDETKDPKYNSPLLLKRMVAAGLLGRKSGEGFFKY